jgi:hypothetical protein
MVKAQQVKEGKIGHGCSVSKTDINHPHVKVLCVDCVGQSISKGAIKEYISLRCYDEASAP